MADKKECINCPGATDHSTAECPMRAPSGAVEVVEVVAWMWRDINGDMQFNYMCPEGEELMTVAQHQRIVAAKDAEIARLNERSEYHEKDACTWSSRACHEASIVYARDKEISELRAQLAAQQAAVPYGYLREVDGQVQLSVGPVRPADRAGGYATPWAPIYAAPAAPQQGVVMPERLREGSERGINDPGWNAALDEVARLNADRSAQGEKP